MSDLHFFDLDEDECDTLLELSADDFAHWRGKTRPSHHGLQSLVEKAACRKTGRVVSIDGMPVVGECRKDARIGKTLARHLLMRATLEPRSTDFLQRFRVSYQMDGKEYYWPTNDLAKVCDWLLRCESSGRACVWTLIVEDLKRKQVFCFAADESQTPIVWFDLRALCKEGGALFDCVSEETPPPT